MTGSVETAIEIAGILGAVEPTTGALATGVLATGVLASGPRGRSPSLVQLVRAELLLAEVLVGQLLVVQRTVTGIATLARTVPALARAHRAPSSATPSPRAMPIRPVSPDVRRWPKRITNGRVKK